MEDERTVPKSGRLHLAWGPPAWDYHVVQYIILSLTIVENELLMSNRNE